jgi:hypothetical protein
VKFTFATMLVASCRSCLPLNRPICLLLSKPRAVSPVNESASAFDSLLLHRC